MKNKKGSLFALVREIPDFPNYSFDFGTMRVFSKKNRMYLKPIERKRSKTISYKLYSDGVAIEMTVFEILLSIFKVIYH